MREEILKLAQENFRKEFPKKEFIAGETYIPPSGKVVDETDLSLLLQASMDMWLTAGRFSRELEQIFSQVLGITPKTLLVNSGSSANLVAVSTLFSPSLENFEYGPIRPGDEIITTATGFPTTVNPIIQNGAIPVFVDVDLETLNALPEKIFAAKTDKTRAVVLAHTLGNPFRSDILAQWCEKEKLYLVEDCCDALGAEVNNQKVGSFGHLGTLSFYPAHHITMGEGGAVFSRMNKIRKVAESMRDWGRDCWCEPGQDNSCKKRFNWQLGELPHGYDHKYIYSNIGYNLKVTDMQAALGISQLKKLPQFIEKRNSNYQKLLSGINSSPKLKNAMSVVKATPESTPSWFGCPIICHDTIDQKKLVRSLEKRKVGTRQVFAGNLIRQPAYKNVNYKVVGDLNNADTVMNKGFWIGLWPGITDEMINYMLESMEGAVHEQLSGL
jgi:CDP-6-deoxy-D-xylo-4-hexulose-3-dehydrase